MALCVISREVVGLVTFWCGFAWFVADGGIDECADLASGSEEASFPQGLKPH